MSDTKWYVLLCIDTRSARVIGASVLSDPNPTTSMSRVYVIYAGPMFLEQALEYLASPVLDWCGPILGGGTHRIIPEPAPVEPS